MEALESSVVVIHESEKNRNCNFPIPFSAVTQTMRPTDFKLNGLTDSSDDLSRDPDDDSTKDIKDLPFIVDEFGFKIDSKSRCSFHMFYKFRILLEDNIPPPFTESAENRRNWMACLEFSYTDSNNEIGEEYTGEDSLWLRLLPHLNASPRLTELIRGIADPQNPSERPKWSGVPTSSSELSPRDGIPHSFRAHIWPRLTRAYELQLASNDNGGSSSGKKAPPSYAEIVRCSSSDSPEIMHQIEKVGIPTISIFVYLKLRKTSPESGFYFLGFTENAAE